MYRIEHLIEDVRQQLKRSSARHIEDSQMDVSEVWKAIDTYVAACFELRRGLDIPRLCRIGWQLSKVLPEPAYEPYFELAPLFSHGLHVEIVAKADPHHTQPRHVLPMEAFSFSKAAIQFSRTQTKKHIYAGLKALTNRLAEVVGQGKEVVIDMHIGKLLAKDRIVSFAFAAQFYTSEGIKVPQSALKDVEYRRPSMINNAFDIYSLRQLLEDVNRQQSQKHTGFVKPMAKINFTEIWAAINRYCVSCLKEKRGVVLPNFCRIGWELSKDKYVLPSHRPYFTLFETFCRSFGVSMLKVGKPPLPDADLAPMEELNFSKAALRFAQNMDKYQFIAGYKLLVQQIGLAMSQDRRVAIEFSFGRISSTHFAVSFAFSSQFLLENGFSPNNYATDDITYTTSTAWSQGKETLPDLTVKAHGFASNGDPASFSTTANSRITPRVPATPRSTNALAASAQLSLGLQTPRIRTPLISNLAEGQPRLEPQLAASSGLRASRADG